MRDLIKSPFLGEVDRRAPLIARSLTRSSSRGSSVGRWLRSASATSWRSSEKRSSLCGVFMWPYTHEGPASRPKPPLSQRAAAASILGGRSGRRAPSINRVASRLPAAGAPGAMRAGAVATVRPSRDSALDQAWAVRRARDGMRRRACGRCCVRACEPSRRPPVGRRLSERSSVPAGAGEALRPRAVSTAALPRSIPSALVGRSPWGHLKPP